MNSMPEALRILRAASKSFEEQLLPALTDEKLKPQAGLVFHALKYVEGLLAAAAPALAQRSERRVQLEREARALLGEGASSALDPSSRDGFTRLIQLAAYKDARGANARQNLAARMEAEAAFLAAIDPDCRGGGGAAYLGGRKTVTADPGTVVSAETLTAWAQEHWSYARDAQIVDVAAMPGGFSKTTVFMTLRRPAGDERLVVRRDLPIPLLGQSVVGEYPLLKKLSAAGYLVAEPLHLESRPQFIGGSFIISKRMPGSVDISAWRGDPRSVKAIARQFAQLLARLHRDGLRELGWPVGEDQRSARECMLREIERWYAFYRAKTREPLPLLEFAFAWLLDNMPNDGDQRPVSLLHGDAGFHNLLVHDGKVTALLDWEFHHVGDPVEDLAYAKMFISQIMPWRDFLDMYEAAGGIRYPDNDQFYTVWSAVRNQATSVDCVSLFESALPNEVKLAVAGYIFGPRLQVEGSQRILDIVNAGAAS